MLATAAIEAMHADTFFGKTYRLDEVLDSVKPQCGDTQSMCYLVDHAEIFGRVGLEGDTGRRGCGANVGP